MNFIYLLLLFVLYSSYNNSVYGNNLDFSMPVTQVSAHEDNKTSFSQRQDLQQSPPLKIIASGFYNEQTGNFIVPEIEIRETDLVTPSFIAIEGYEDIPIVTFQLRKKDETKPLKEIKQPVFKMKMEIFHKDGSVKNLPAPSLLLAAFNLPENSQEGELWVYVLNPKGTVIYSAPVPVSQ